jgi:Uma2 family endonuclease
MTTAELVIPEPPLELLDEKYLEYLDGQWIKKESVGRKKHEDVTKAIYNLLNRYSRLVGGELAEHWTIILGPDKAEPDVTLSHPISNIYQGYLVSPAFLVVEVRSYGQTLPYLVNKCKDRYHRALESPIAGSSTLILRLVMSVIGKVRTRTKSKP